MLTGEELLALIDGAGNHVLEAAVGLVAAVGEGHLNAVRGAGQAVLFAVGCIIRRVVGVAVAALGEAVTVMVICAAGASVPLAVIEVAVACVVEIIQIDVVEVVRVIFVVNLTMRVGIQARQKAAACRTAHRGDGIVLLKSCAAGCQRVKIRMQRLHAAVCTVAIVGLMVVQDEQEIRFFPSHM